MNETRIEDNTHSTDNTHNKRNSDNTQSIEIESENESDSENKQTPEQIEQNEKWAKEYKEGFLNGIYGKYFDAKESDGHCCCCVDPSEGYPNMVLYVPKEHYITHEVAMANLLIPITKDSISIRVMLHNEKNALTKRLEWDSAECWTQSTTIQEAHQHIGDYFRKFSIDLIKTDLIE